MKKSLLPIIGSLALLAVGAHAAAVIGLNITDGWGTPCLLGETADGSSNWTDSRAAGDWTDPSFGTVALDNSSGVSASWNSSNTWAGGNEDTSEQQLYRVYLDDGDGGNSLVNGDGIGVSVTITGLGAWLAAEGATAYQVRVYASTDNDNASFQPVDIRIGAPDVGSPDLTALSIAETVPVPAIGPGDFPPNTEPDPTWGLWQSRGYGDSSNSLTADTITLTVPARDGTTRGALAGFKITAVPEPGAIALLGLGFVTWWSVRRRKA